MNEIDKASEGDDRKVAQLGQELDYQERIKKRNELNKIVQLLDQEDQLKQDIGARSSASDDARTAFAGLDQKISEIEANEQIVSALIEDLKGKRKKLMEGKGAAEQRATEKHSATIRAHALAERIREFLADPGKRFEEVTVWKWPLVALSSFTAFIFLILGLFIICGSLPWCFEPPWSPACPQEADDRQYGSDRGVCTSRQRGISQCWRSGTCFLDSRWTKRRITAIHTIFRY